MIHLVLYQHPPVLCCILPGTPVPLSPQSNGFSIKNWKVPGPLALVGLASSLQTCLGM